MKEMFNTKEISYDRRDKYIMHLPRFNKITYGLVSSGRRALASKLRGPGFKSRPGTVGGPVTIIMCDARPGWKLALS